MTETHFAKAINKYGWNNFEHIILFENLSQKVACIKEQELIQLYNTCDPKYGYNSTLGGECGSAGLHWYNNGIEQKRIKIEDLSLDINKNFERGKLKKSG